MWPRLRHAISRKQLALRGRLQLKWLSALGIVILHLIEPRIDGIASHHFRIVGPQHFRQSIHILHSGIEPCIVIGSVKDDWHSVVDCGGNRVRSRSQNRTRPNPFPTGIFPAFPQASEREQL